LILAKSEKAKGGEQYHKGSTGSLREPVPTLADLGLSKKVSARAHKITDATRRAVLVEKRRTFMPTKLLDSRERALKPP